MVLTVGDLDGNIEGFGVGLEIRLLGSTIGVDEVDELGREVGAGEGLPFMYDGANVGDTLGAHDGHTDGFGVVLGTTYVWSCVGNIVGDLDGTHAYIFVE